MANYVFETMSTTDAANFTSADRLFFETASVSTLGVTDNPATSGPLSSTAESITLSSGTHTLTFSAAQLSAASVANNLIFVNGDALLVGTAASQNLVYNDAGHGHANLVYGFDGDDTIFGTSAANDTIDGGKGSDHIFVSSSYTDASGHFTESDYAMGGAGDDTVVGGAGNDHLYGNLQSSTAGAADGNDAIWGNDGNDYLQGNAGADTLQGGNDNDKLYGGADNDKLFGGNGNDYLQGNKGDDSISGNSGNDTVHGGAGDDTVRGASGNDQIYGDNGNDLILGDSGYDTLSGGAGNDIFLFFQNDASNANVSVTTGASAGLTDVIGDFTSGEDHISLAYNSGPPGWTVNHVYHAQAGVTFTSVAAAQVYAEQLMDAGTYTGEVAAIQVGSDTYLFYNGGGLNGGASHDVTGLDAAHSIDSAIKLTGVTASAITTSDFV